MTRIDIKPLSVNDAWKGQRFKTTAYKIFERSLLYMLPAIKLPEAPYHVHLHFAFSSTQSDIDNPTKLILDVMQKKYAFNDKNIFKLTIEKELVEKGKEHFQFCFTPYEKSQQQANNRVGK